MKAQNMYIKRPVIIIAGIILAAGCGGGTSGGSNGELVACEDPRPEICTLEFAPVCGRFGSGRAFTFANACNACSVAGVTAYSSGECTGDTLVACETPPPGPQPCTADFSPVCAERRDGGQQTFANACNACSDAGTFGYAPGECQ